MKLVALAVAVAASLGIAPVVDDGGATINAPCCRDIFI